MCIIKKIEKDIAAIIICLGGTKLFNWGIWFIEMVIATFFISGFVVVYNRIAVSLLTTMFAHLKRRHLWTSVSLSLFVFVMVVFCQLAKYLNPINAEAYMNWALYVLFVPLMNKEVNLPVFVVRSLGILAFWTYNSNVHDPFFLVSVISIVALQWVTWHWQTEASNHWALHMGIVLWAASAFWFTQTQLALVDIVMAIVMFAVMNIFTIVYWSADRITSLEHDRLVKQVNQDTLTGAGSLFAFKEDLTTQIQLARRRGGKLTLAMFDIDFFKKVNDRFGHAAGNYVLTAVSRKVTQLIKDNGYYRCHLYRTGGEEFNIIVEGACSTDIAPFANEILATIRAQDFVFEGNAIHVTISMGITSLVPDDTGMEDLYERADACLYRAKRNGRDQIFSSMDTAISGIAESLR